MMKNRKKHSSIYPSADVREHKSSPKLMKLKILLQKERWHPCLSVCIFACTKAMWHTRTNACSFLDR